MRYSFSIVHVPGKYLYTADALSRAPLRGTIDRGSEEFQWEVYFYVNAVLVQLPASDRRLINKTLGRQGRHSSHCQPIREWPDDKHKVQLIYTGQNAEIYPSTMGCCFGVHYWLCHQPEVRHTTLHP